MPALPHRMLVRLMSIAAVAALCACTTRVRPPAAIDVPAVTRPEGESATWWYRAGAARAAALGATRGTARNVILFVGDGMSIPTIAAARIFEAQLRGAPGEENGLSFEQFPHTALSKTYNTDAQTPDSAGTMTAMATGVKTRIGYLSMDQHAPPDHCGNAEQHRLYSLLEIAEAAGMATGVVTTTRITHATPAATYAHAADRAWESDVALAPAAIASGCIDIARQLVATSAGDGPEVILGGGRSRFMPDTANDPEYPDRTGMRRDKRDLIQDWLARRAGSAYVWNRAQLEALDLTRTPAVLGLFEPEHMRFEHDRSADAAGEPSLAQMTLAAIRRLAREPKGFVLLVEAGRIDHAHHLGNAFRALVDTVALSDAVREAQNATTPEDTLIVVTADHSHTLTFAGYPTRGNPILGKVRGASGESNGHSMLALDALGLPYTTLGYANGPGYTGASDAQSEGPKRVPHDFSRQSGIRAGRPDLTDVDTQAPDYLQEATVPMHSESHGGEDVAIYAHGSGSAAFRGVLEQNVIFHLMIQSTPRLREFLCTLRTCNGDGVPLELPRSLNR